MSELRIKLPGERRPSLVAGVYEDLATKVTARVEGDELVCPLPRARFAALELAAAFGLGADFVAEHEAQSRRIGGPSRLGAAEGEAWWRYVRARGHLRTTWPSADVVVPELPLFARKRDGAVSRVLVWPEESSTLVLPEAADFVVLKPSLMVNLPRPARPVHLLPRAAVLAAIGDRAERGGPDPVPHRLYRGGEGTHVRIIAQLRQADGVLASDFRPVSADAVVDA